jgi:hypothetical protein
VALCCRNRFDTFYVLPSFPLEVTSNLVPERASKFSLGSKLRGLVIDAIHRDVIAKGML